MLRIKKITAGRANYYLALARSDYYLEGGPRPGYWLGAARERLGVDGEVDPTAFRRLLAGFAPDGVTRLRQNAGGGLSGWDLTLLAPKSVSVLYSQVGDATRETILACHRTAVAGTAAALEVTAGLSRRGRGGAEQERADVVFAAFEHYTSRADDTLIHTHLVFPNLAVRADGSTGALHPSALYAGQREHFGDGMYKTLLAMGLEHRLDLALERDGRDFEIAGVPKTLCDAFSKRREQVLAYMTEHKLDGDRDAERAALRTRERKSHRPLPELLAMWRKVGREHGWSTEQAEALVRHRDPEQTLSQDRGDARAAVRAAREQLDKDLETAAARFGRPGWLWRHLPPGPNPFDYTGELLAKALKEGYRRGISPEVTATAAATYLRVLRASEHEDALEVAALRRATPNRHPVASSLVRSTQPERPLTAAQAAAVSAVCTDPLGLSVVSLRPRDQFAAVTEAAAIWKAAGYRVRVTVPGRDASELFEKASGIATATLAKTLANAERWVEREVPASLPKRLVELARYATRRSPRWQLEEALGHFVPAPPRHQTILKEATANMSRRARLLHDRRRAREPYRLSENTVLVALDAEKLRPRDMLRLLAVTERSGAKLVLVGDGEPTPRPDATRIFDAVRHLNAPDQGQTHRHSLERT